MFDQDVHVDSEAGAAEGRGFDLEVWRAELAAELEEFDLGVRADPFATPLSQLARVDSVADHDSWAAPDATDVELRAIAVALERTRRALDAMTLDTLAELDARGVTDQTDGMRTGAWLARETATPVNVANRQVRLADKLRAHLPEVATALAEGQIGIDHAQVLADAANPRILDEFPIAVPALIGLAARMPFHAWKREVAGVAEHLDADGGHRPHGGDPSDNTLSMHRGVGNTWVLRGEFTDELGLAVHDALHARANRLFHRLHRDEDTTPDLRTPGHATILALALAELTANHPGGGSASRTGVSLVVNATDPDHVTDSDGVVIGDTGLTTLWCDPVFHPVVTNTHGVAIALGRDHHLVNRAQRRALEHRDGGCVFPGCDRPATWTDAHHVEHWRHGGPTDLSNLASLCRYHHGVTHRTGWTMHVTHDQWFWWTTPHGDTFWSQRHQRPRAGPTPTS